MQQTPQMIPPMVPSFPPTNITTEQIQKYLDDNKKLIMAILENQNLGKLAECAQYQALLQKNLMYLAAIADAQPQPPAPATAPAAAPAPAMAPQMAPHPAMQPPGYFMQHPQATAMSQQAPAGIFPPRSPLQFSSPHQLQDQQQQQQQLHPQATQGQMGMKPMGINSNGLQHAMHHPETTLGSGRNGGTNDAPGGSKQDGCDGGESRGDGHGGSARRKDDGK